MSATTVAATSDIEKAVELLRTAGSVVVIGHINPDGDALGSVFALTAALRSIGVPAVPTWGSRHRDQPPAPLSAELEQVLPTEGLELRPEVLPSAPDVVVSCDTAAATRLGTLQPLLEQAGAVIVVDHHAVGEAFGDVRLVDEHAFCTGVLVTELIDHLGVDLTPEIANAVYLALVTDTGRFGFSATSADDHRLAARLLEAGADNVAVAEAVYASASRGYLTMVSRVTARAVIDDQLICSYVTLEDLEDAGSSADEPDGLIELLRSVGGIDVTCFLRETRPGEWRSSLRSRGGTDVAAVAHALGGGGHRMAAGFTGHGDAEDVLAAVRSHLPGSTS